jgi:hypothetical protein
MKTMRYMLAAVVLVSAISASTFAGDMHTGIAPDPEETPATAQGEMTTGVTGTMHTGNSDAADDSVAADVVGLVVDVLSSLF